HLPIRFIQANHTLDSLNLAGLEGVGRITHTGGKLAIGNVKATISNTRPSVARADARAPAHRWAARRKLLNYPCLAPNPIAICPQPLRPVFRPHRVTTNKAGTEHSESKLENSMHRLML